MMQCGKFKVTPLCCDQFEPRYPDFLVNQSMDLYRLMPGKGQTTHQALKSEFLMMITEILLKRIALE